MNEAMLPQPAAPWPMYRALVGIGMLCGLLIVFVYAGTLPVIKANRAAALERAVFTVLPAATRRVSFVLGPDGGFAPAAEDVAAERVHAGFDDAGRLVGVAIEASGMGYADTISLLYGYAPEREAIVGMQVLASKETPGLGNKIESDPAFLANFAALDVRLDESGRAPLHAIETVKQGKKSQPWQIDGITGATVSSQAIGDILAASSARWVPIINERIDDLAAGATDGSP